MKSSTQLHLLGFIIYISAKKGWRYMRVPMKTATVQSSDLFGMSNATKNMKLRYVVSQSRSVSFIAELFRFAILQSTFGWSLTIFLDMRVIMKPIANYAILNNSHEKPLGRRCLWIWKMSSICHGTRNNYVCKTELIRSCPSWMKYVFLLLNWYFSLESM